MRDDYTDGFRKGQEDRRAGKKIVRLDEPDRLDEWESASEQWKEGWSDGYEQGR